MHIERKTPMTRTLVMLLLGAVLTICVVPASAQKKEPAKKEAVKKEPAPPVQPPQPQSTMKDLMLQYVGKATSLGTLKKVAGDYFVLEDDGDTVMHPLSTIHTIRLVKDEETGETRIEIRLIGKD